MKDACAHLVDTGEVTIHAEMPDEIPNNPSYFERLVSFELDIAPFYHLMSANMAAGLSPKHHLEYERECSLTCHTTSAKLIYDRPQEPTQCEILVTCLSKEAVKRTVI